MQLKLSFLGASRNVTGSRFLLEANNSRILIDCGLYQEREFRNRNWDPFPMPPDTLDAVLLTHAHQPIDFHWIGDFCQCLGAAGS